MPSKWPAIVWIAVTMEPGLAKGFIERSKGLKPERHQKVYSFSILRASPGRLRPFDRLSVQPYTMCICTRQTKNSKRDTNEGTVECESAWNKDPV
ncbi:MAG: hypothetical protein JO081_07155 [Alphaproteobacteria bacterium]|nr:hypothetical protein [Alphaproteobacteria bacterium]